MIRITSVYIVLFLNLGVVHAATQVSENSNASEPVGSHTLPLTAGNRQYSKVPTELAGQQSLTKVAQLPTSPTIQQAKPLAPSVNGQLVAHQSVGDDPEVYQGVNLEPVPEGKQGEHFASNLPYPGCQSCQGGESLLYNRCGCQANVFPWLSGPGNCDQWCVGPKWQVEVDGLMLFHKNAAWDPVLAAVGGASSLVTQFDQAPGARVFVTGYNHSSFGMQVGYEGVYSWDATAVFPQAGSIRRFDFETSLNSVEINFLQRNEETWKLFGGFRYVEIQDRLNDATTVDKVLPLPADPPAAAAAYVDSGTRYLLKNRLLGFQLGARRDTWQWNEWFTVEAFSNIGIYSNMFRRNDVTYTNTTVINGDDLSTPDTNEFSQQVTTVETKIRSDFTDLAILGEVGITGMIRINSCVALRGGYQAMVVDGIGQGINAFLAGGLNRETGLYHGLQFGAEYRR